jgi:shikimate kinase
VRNKDTRPLLSGAHPYETLKRIYKERVPIYKMSDLSVKSAPEVPIEDMAKQVLSVLETRRDVIG